MLLSCLIKYLHINIYISSYWDLPELGVIPYWNSTSLGFKFDLKWLRLVSFSSTHKTQMNKTNKKNKYHDKVESDGWSIKKLYEKASKLLLLTQFHDNKSSQWNYQESIKINRTFSMWHIVKEVLEPLPEMLWKPEFKNC